MLEKKEKSKEKQGEFVRRLPVRPVIGDPAKKERPSGMVVVRLAAGASPVEQDKVADTLVSHAEMYALKGLLRVLESADSPESYRLVRSVPAEKILDMEREAAQSKFPPLHSLTQYWRLDLRERSREEISQIIEMLMSLPEVESAWEEPLDTLPVVTPGDDPYNASQGYQDAAPDGINARWMWTQPSGEGAGIGIVDVEGGWRVTHEDLVGKTPTLIHGAQYASWEDHGTAVLGVIVAVDNTVGVVGSAPAITSVRMSSIYDAGGVQHTLNALIAAVAAMSIGEILLIELQTSFLPVETLDDRLDVIRLATARGITVVEPAGNGNSDLDAWTTPGGLQRLNRASADFVDSGAIMVAAAEPTVPHDRVSGAGHASNFGSRIDCYAWGKGVVTCGYGDLDDGGGDDDKAYTDTFKNTSSASPIIVSAAALVQSNYQATTGTLLSPVQMRALLANPATGTAQGFALPGAIGVMPDLASIVPTLGLVPDIYLRDAVGDTGTVPWTGSISASPDVIVLPSSVADPQLAFGEGSGTENSATLGYEAESVHDNTIYVRVRNRGGSPATNVIATVYWSEVATLVTPSTWHLIGNVTLPSVPVGDVLTVSPALTWLSAAIPATGHYCFVATLQHPNDPAPPTPGPLDWSSFQDMIRAHNNVTWRNFNVVNDLPDTPDATPSFAFNLAGAEDRARPFAFEIERRLPADAVLELEGPLGMLERLKGESPWKLVRDKKNRNARLVLPMLPRIMLEEVRIPGGARLPCKFNIHLRKGRIEFGHGVTIRQIYKGEEIGRIVWQFAPKLRLRHEMKKR
ncbi:MAG: S8 family serine peptidase [Desulfobacteraceae bacterium]|nr:S8 family serine peptidase [Desulfobacteraceae bacterium]